MAVQKPLMLKDYLELEESSSVGFQCYPRRLPETPPMWKLLDAELRIGPRLIRTRSKSTLERISSMIKLRFSAKQEGFLSRSFSRKLKDSLWKRRLLRQGTNGQINFEEEIDRKSFNYPSPVVSSFRSWMEIDERFVFPSRSGSAFVSAESPARQETISSDDKQTDQKIEEMESMEQLSPVSVMDFPFDEEEEDDVATATTSSPSFQYQSITNSERSKLQIQQKRITNLGAINLEDQFNESESEIDDEDKVFELLRQLGPEEPFQKLLEDFFTDGISVKKERIELLKEASEWIDGEGCIWESKRRRGVMEMEEMEKIRKWRCFDKERLEISVYLESFLLEELLDEVVL